MNSQEFKKRSLALLIILVVSTVGITWFGLATSAALRWPIIVAFMLIMFIAIGWCVKGRLAGVLINDRNMMSLSRFQMVLWSLIVLSAFTAIAMARASDGTGTSALDIAVPPQIWMLMGISSAALVGSPLLASNKVKKRPIGTLQSRERADMGILSVKLGPEDASFGDLFKGEEIKNWDDVDLARLQMFFFTIIVAIIYCIEVYQIVAFGDLSENIALPAVDEGMVTLTGISNTAYLGSKAIDQTPAERKQ
ncbi:hypothetical protein [Kaarinaea lacus]